MNSLFRNLSVERNHPDHQGEAVVLDPEGSPVYFALASQTDEEIFNELGERNSGQAKRQGAVRIRDDGHAGGRLEGRN